MEVGDISKVAVLGAGNMGHGIAEVIALAGFEVAMRDITKELVEKGYQNIVWSLGKLAEKGQISEEKLDETLERISISVEIKETVEGADIVVEAIPEIMELKKELYKEVNKYLSDETLVLSNTSSLSITELAEVVSGPERVCGLHFFNPPIKMPLIEVISGDLTSKKTFEMSIEFAKAMGKFPVGVYKDSPGFIVNRILTPLLNEAAWIVHENRGSIAQVESSVKYGLGLPMGAFELSDQVGIDVAVHVLEYLHEKLGSAYEPCPLLVEKRDSGELGKKVGKGFYDYSKNANDISVEERSEEIELLLTACMSNEVAKLLELEVAEISGIDQAMKLGTGIENGSAQMADKIGLDILHKILLEKYEETGNDRYKPAKFLADLANKKESFYGMSGSDSTSFVFKNIEIEKDEKLGKILLNRPHRLNAITSEMIEEINDALDIFEKDNECGAILITGAGEKSFCAGADILSFASGFSDKESARALSKKGQDLFEKFEQHNLPIIAGIDGYCFGGGMELAAACDLRIASERSLFGQPERNLGILPAWGGTQRLMHIMGETRAKELNLLGRKDYDSKTMFGYGFINEVVKNGNFTERLLEIAKLLSEGPPLAQGMIKKAMLTGRNDPENGFEVETESLCNLIGTDDLTEGITAFLSKRKPEFKGK